MAENCFHCGDDIIGKGYPYNQKNFCCNGCRSVYQLLHENNMDTFYQLNDRNGVKPASTNEHKYNFLDIESIATKYIDFQDDNISKVTLFLPQIHCSSCIYLLENISKIEPKIISCQVNFAKKEAIINFKHNELKLSELAQLLDNIGYAANFGNKKATEKKIDKIFMYKLGFAGFAFGSIMLWSFPEYLGIEDMQNDIRNFTSYLSLLVSLPVFFYSANEYFISAYKAIKYKSLNLDVPISLGIVALYAQSVFSIINNDGPGYMDSFAGFIFFLLIGKWFQSKTYKSLSFERDYTSYFPVAVTRKKDTVEEIVEIESLEIGDKIIIRNEEVIPSDCQLVSEEARIDYSFVTGESVPIEKKKGDFIYAGGKLIGKSCEFEVLKESNRSHLTQIWNEVANNKQQKFKKSTQDKISYYFLVVLLIIAGITGIVWAFIDWTRITQVIVSILIVACPCALALSAPFTFGNIMRVLGRKGLYLKNTPVIESMNEVTDIVFDKTGTLTTGVNGSIEYIGKDLTLDEIGAIIGITYSSTHPLSRGIVNYLKKNIVSTIPDLETFEEISGKGIEGKIDGKTIKIGSATFVGENIEKSKETEVHISINNEYKGRFVFHSTLREGMSEMVKNLSKYRLHILSGDNDKDDALLKSVFKNDTEIKFNQTPNDKLKYIEQLKDTGKTVMMIGDGLNDAGALGKSDVGIAVSEDIFRFTPSSDAIIDASKLVELPKFLKTALYSKTVLTSCLAFSITYNIIGLSLAMTDQMTPLVAAILMPISSITVVGISTGMVLVRKD